MNILIHPDYETPRRVGADGYFQIYSIVDDNGNDWSAYIDQGQLFNSGHDVMMTLSSNAKKRIENFSFV